MSKDTTPETTPAAHGVRMSEQHYQMIRVIVAFKDWYLKDFFSQAYEDFLAKRKELLAEGKEDEWMRCYQPSPAKGKYYTVNVTEADLDPLQEAADQDNVKLTDAAWSAIYMAIHRLKGELNLDQLVGGGK